MLTQIKKDLAQKLSLALSKPAEQLEQLLEIPKKHEHGELALPVFIFAKELRKAPPEVAKEIAATLSANNWSEIEKIEALSGFVNFRFQMTYLQSVLATDVEKQGAQIGYSKSGEGQVMAIDFSSPNVAKPMSIGHLRATVIGQAICNLAKTQSYKVIGINHLGDWGVQFGKLAWAYKKWGSEYDFQNKPFESLYALYVRFHEEAEKDESLNQEGSLVFKKMEQGDPESEKMWKSFVDISMQEYTRLWNMLGVKHDLVRGESFYNDRLKPTEALLEKKGLLKESEGAMVVDLEPFGMPPCLIRKSDGASLYATRDIAAAIFRAEELHADLNVYVVGVEQSLHFKQLFKVLELMGYPWAKGCHHVAFGLYKFKDLGKMSSRKGNVIRLEDVVDRAIEMVEKIIEEKNPNLENKAQVAKQVGIGAITFNDLVNDRVKNVDFDWEKVLSFEGDSGPFVQYCHVRCVSILKKYGQPVPKQFSMELTSPEERELIGRLLNFSETLRASFQHFKPHILAGYLLDVCRSFSQFYHNNRILGEAPQIESSRMVLVSITQKILAQGLKVLNIEAPDAM